VFRAITVSRTFTARPLLAQRDSASEPTPQEARLLDETVRRVDTMAVTNRSQNKDEQSPGPSSVELLILAGEDARRSRYTSADRKALEELWKEQRAEEHEWLDFGLEPYEFSDSVYYGAAPLPGRLSGQPSLPGLRR